jgi:hypothetical protein
MGDSYDKIQENAQAQGRYEQVRERGGGGEEGGEEEGRERGSHPNTYMPCAFLSIGGIGVGDRSHASSTHIARPLLLPQVSFFFCALRLSFNSSFSFLASSLPLLVLFVSYKTF